MQIQLGPPCWNGEIGKGQPTVSYWVKTGAIPVRWQSKLLQLAKEQGVELTAQDFIVSIKNEQATHKSIKNNGLVAIMPNKTATNPKQATLDLGIQKQGDIMDKTPIDLMLDKIDWIKYEDEERHNSELPYAIHSGILRIGDIKLKCYRLNNGMAVFDADDVEKFFDNMSE